MKYVKPKPGAKPWKSKQLDFFGNPKPTKAQSRAYDVYRKAWQQVAGYNVVKPTKAAKKRFRQAAIQLALTHHNPGVVRVKAHTIRRAGRLIRIRAHARKRR